MPMAVAGSCVQKPAGRRRPFAKQRTLNLHRCDLGVAFATLRNGNRGGAGSPPSVQPRSPTGKNKQLSDLSRPNFMIAIRSGRA